MASAETLEKDPARHLAETEKVLKKFLKLISELF